MATLAGSTIASTYPLLLKIDTTGLDGTLRAVEDGDGTDSVLSLATDSALISGNGTKLYFYDADGGEHISADNAGNLTIGAGADINLTTTTDINIPADVGLTFGHASNQKIEGDGTDLAVSATGNINITSTVNEAASIYLRENAGGSGTIKIHADQGTADTSIDILSDAGGISITSGNDKDVFIKGSDGGSGITAATFDMSDAGSLSLNNNLTLATGKILYLDGGGNSYIHEAATDRVIIVAGGENRVVANELGVGFGKVPSYKMAISFATGDIDIKDAGTGSATEAGWIQVAIGGGSDSYIRTYSSK